MAWGQLTAYIRATVLVAAVDAVGITAGALILRVPFALAIGVLVFLLSFIPIVGALLSGAVAVLIALVAQGPVTALIMLAVVVGVQQLESHVLQPFILGRSVRIHPMAVIAAIAYRRDPRRHRRHARRGPGRRRGQVGGQAPLRRRTTAGATTSPWRGRGEGPHLDDAPLAAGESPA